MGLLPLDRRSQAGAGLELRRGKVSEIVRPSDVGGDLSDDLGQEVVGNALPSGKRAASSRSEARSPAARPSSRASVACATPAPKFGARPAVQSAAPLVSRTAPRRAPPPPARILSASSAASDGGSGPNEPRRSSASSHRAGENCRRRIVRPRQTKAIVRARGENSSHPSSDVIDIPRSTPSRTSTFEKISAVGTSGAPAFERFTLRARNVLASAAAAADDTGQRAIGTGHLLLGLFTEPDGVAARALADTQIDRDEVAQALRAAWAQAAGADDVTPRPAGPPDSADPATLPTGDLAARKPLSAAGHAAVMNAVAVALELRHNYIGTEHILLGLYRDPDSLAARVLADAGGDPSEVRVRVAELLRGYAKP